jgi:hypothetical protein
MVSRPDARRGDVGNDDEPVPEVRELEQTKDVSLARDQDRRRGPVPRLAHSQERTQAGRVDQIDRAHVNGNGTGFVVNAGDEIPKLVNGVDIELTRQRNHKDLIQSLGIDMQGHHGLVTQRRSSTNLLGGSPTRRSPSLGAVARGP